MALPPIIKIKRGNGLPPIWDGSVGITHGEFAFDRDTNVLYLGLSGGGYNLSSPYAQNDLDAPMVIPIGMQISDDAAFGGSSPIVNTNVGYSHFTIPTTYAVRQYILDTVVSQSLGVTFESGSGIDIDYNTDGSDVIVTVTNTGSLFAFRNIGFGGSYSGYSLIGAGNTADRFNLNAKDGIHINVSKSGSFYDIGLHNHGVLDISGQTGSITTFDPIASLDGFTADVTGVMIERLNIQNGPLTLTPDPISPKLYLSHDISGVNDGDYLAINGNTFRLPNIRVDEFGHITNISQTPLSFTNIIPPGFTEAVQDAAFPAITGGGNPYDTGIGFTYDDDNDRLIAYLRAVKNIGIYGSSNAGICGSIKLYGYNPGIEVGFTSIGGVCGFEFKNTAYSYTTVSASTNPQGNPDGIWYGGTGSGSATTNAKDKELKLIAGRGIGISAGNIGNDRTVFMWNAGINKLQFKDNSNTNIGSGMSGNVNIVAGNGIAIQRDGTNNDGQTITITGTPSEGLGSLRADYELNATSPLGNFYAGDGLTGNIEVVGKHGLVTRQDSPNTSSGSLYIELSSQIKLPEKTIWNQNAGPNQDYNDGTGRAFIEIPDAIRMENLFEQDSTNLLYELGSELPPSEIDQIWADDGYKSFISVDKISGGLTGTLEYTGQPLNAGIPAGTYNHNRIIPTDYSPGKILTLYANPGSVSGQIELGADDRAAIRLLGYPNAEHMGAEIFRNLNVGDLGGANPCINGCVGFPPLPAQCPTGLAEGQWQYQLFGENTELEKGTIITHGNMVLKDSLYVTDDIWVAGNLIDAKTGCLISSGANGSNGVANTCIECLGDGNVGITGYLRIDDDIYVHGDSAFFNVTDFAVETNVLKIGGFSGGVMTIPSGGGANSHKGLELAVVSAIGANPITQVSNSANRLSFVGIKASDTDSPFTYIPSATKSDISGTITYSGTPGPAHFLTYNNVGITSNSGAIELKAAATNYQNLNTNIKLQGIYDIIGPVQNTTKAEINLGSGSKLSVGQSAKLTIADTANNVVFLRGITFNTATAAYSGDAGNAGNNLQLTWLGSTDTSLRRMYIRNLGVNAVSQLVDVGKHIASLDSTTDLASASDSGRQTLWNKTLGDGTIIDCGSY